jgi:hypothetical protein
VSAFAHSDMILAHDVEGFLENIYAKEGTEDIFHGLRGAAKETWPVGPVLHLSMVPSLPLTSHAGYFC